MLIPFVVYYTIGLIVSILRLYYVADVSGRLTVWDLASSVLFAIWWPFGIIIIALLYSENFTVWRKK